MEEWQREYIRKNITRLIQDTTCNTLLLAELQSRGVINGVDIEKLTALKGSDGPTCQAHYLYSFIQQQNNGYEDMIVALRNCNQTGALKTLLDGYHTHGKATPFLKIDYDAILSAEVNFQGATSKLSQLFPQLTTSDLKEILTDEKARIDYSNIFIQKSKAFVLAVDTIPDPPEHYISRSISNRLKLDPAVFKVACEDVFVFKGLDRVELTNLAHPTLTSGSGRELLEVSSRFIYLEQDEDWQEIRNVCKKPVHLIKYEAEKYVVEDSSGGSNFLRQYIQKSSDDQQDVYISESDLLNKLEESKKRCGICICDTPGMGKTMLLASLARSIKQRHPDRIIGFIRLSDFAQNLSADRLEMSPEFNSSLKLILEHITDSYLSVAILDIIIKRHGARLDLFFDGLDEVPTQSLKWAMQFIQSLIVGSENITAYVTSRPHVRNELETTLGVLALDILPFTQKNQADFLIQFWKGKIPSPISEDRLENFANICLENVHKTMSKDERSVMGIPLQCFLLAEVYTPEVRLFSCPSRKQNPLSLRPITLNEMYKKFIDLRLSTCDPLKRRSIKSLHILMALELLFPQIAKVYSKIVPRPIKANVFSYGIVEISSSLNDSRVTFIHRTIAEFLVAEYIGDLIFAKNGSFLHQVLNSRTNADVKRIIKFFTRLVFANTGTISGFPKMNYGHAAIMYFINAYVSNQNQEGNSINVLFARTVANSLEPREYHNTLRCSICQNHLHIFRLLKLVLRVAGTSRTRMYLQNVFKGSADSFEINCEYGLFWFFYDAVQNSNVTMLNEIFDFYKEFVGFSNFTSTFPAQTPLHMALELQKNYEVVECLIRHFGTNHSDLLRAFLSNLVVYSNSKVEIGENERRVFNLLQQKQQSYTKSNKFQKDLKFPWNQLNPRISSLNIIKFLVQEGADLLAVNDENENVAHVTAKYLLPKDYHELCEYLMEQCKFPSDVNLHVLSSKNKFGQSPLHTRLVSDGFTTLLSTVNIFLGIPNIKINDEDCNGENLFLAAVRGKEKKDILKFLIDRGAEVHVFNKNHQNALHLAVNTPEIFEYLMSLEISTELENAEGYRPFD